MDPRVSELVEVVVFVPNPPLDVEESNPNPEGPVAYCKNPFPVVGAAVPKIAPVVAEDEGCTAAVEMPVAVVLNVWAFEDEELVPNSPPVIGEDSRDLLFEETALVPKGLPLFCPKRPFGDETLDVVLPEEPNPEKPVVLEGEPLDASLLAVIPKILPVELVFGV